MLGHPLVIDGHGKRPAVDFLSICLVAENNKTGQSLQVQQITNRN